MPVNFKSNIIMEDVVKLNGLTWIRYWATVRGKVVPKWVILECDNGVRGSRGGGKWR